MSSVKECKLEKINATPVADLFTSLKKTKDSQQKSIILSKIVTRLTKGISKVDRKAFWQKICNLEQKVGNGEFNS